MLREVQDEVNGTVETFRGYAHRIFFRLHIWPEKAILTRISACLILELWRCLNTCSLIVLCNHPYPCIPYLDIPG